VADRWAQAGGWQVTSVDTHGESVIVTVLGLPPAPAADALRKELDAAGMGDADLQVRLVAGGMRDCPPGRGSCIEQQATSTTESAPHP
jgi:hypothetical protein